MESCDSEEMHPQTKRKWYMINHKLLAVKAFYFFFYAAIGDLLPFVSVYMRQQGLSSGEAGIIYGIMPFLAFFTCPLVGALADRIHKHKFVLMTCTVLTGLCYTLLLTIPGRHIENSVKVRTNIHCNPQDSFIRDCVEYADSKEACYLTLREYGNLTSLSNTSEQISCDAECRFAEPGAYSSQVCFTKDAASFDNKKCIEVWISASSSEVVRVKLLNVSEIVRHEIVRDAVETPHLHCKEYDLKQISYSNTPYWQMLCKTESILHCVLTCSHNVHSKCHTEVQIKNSFGITFWMFLLVLIVANICFSPICNIIDAVTYTVLEKKHKKWGFQRLWGSMGFAIFAIASTFIMDTMSHQQKRIDYSFSFYIFFGLCLIAAVDSFFLPISSKLTCGHFIKNIFKVISDPRVASFLVVVTVFGIFVGAIEGFLFWYLLNLGSSQLLLGLCLAFNCVPEIVFLFFSGRVIQKIGHVMCLYLACGAYFVRFLSYSFLENPWYALLIEPIHGITFALMWAAATSYASIIAPPGMAAITQGLIGGLHFGFGKGTGSLLTGFMFESLRERWTFRLLAGVALILLAVYVLVNVCCLKGHVNKKDSIDTGRKEDDDESSDLHDHLVSDSPEESPSKHIEKSMDAGT